MSAVDDFILHKVLPEHQDIVGALREIMADAVPEASFDMSYGLPMWKRRGFLAYISPSKQGITFGFPYGVRYDDPHKVLRGKAKNARHIRYRRASDIDEEVLRFYIAQALAGDMESEQAGKD